MIPDNSELNMNSVNDPSKADQHQTLLGECSQCKKKDAEIQRLKEEIEALQEGVSMDKDGNKEKM